MFEAEKRFIEPLIANWLCGSIEHVGSTAVEGLAAKPVIDIMVGVKTLSDSTDAIQQLTDNGYCYYPYKNDVMHWFCKPSPHVRTHHLHLIPYQSELWLERLAFRDYLRANPKTAQDYGALKRRIAAECNDDREAYTQRKWPFIKQVLELAKQ